MQLHGCQVVKLVGCVFFGFRCSQCEVCVLPKLRATSVGDWCYTFRQSAVFSLSVVVGAETWTLRAVDKKHLGSFEM